MNRFALFLTVLASSIVFSEQNTDQHRIGSAATAHPLATETAELIYQRGGNAVDAAVAASFVLSVVEPSMSGLGGRAQAVIRTESGRFVGFNGMTEIPESYALSKDMPDHGFSTVATPGLVALLWDMHSKYGVLPFKQVISPAIEFAERGFQILPGEATRHQSVKQKIISNEGMRAAFINNLGNVFSPEELFKQSQLAKTLRKIALNGSDAFYRGDIAKVMSDDIQKGGGFVTEQDLKNYEVLEGRYISFQYRDVTVHTLAAPAGGGLVAKALMLMSHYDLENYDDRKWAVIVSQAIALSIESMSENYYEKDLKLLIDPNWAKLNRKRIISPSLNVNSVELISSDPDMNDTDWVGQPGAHTSHLVTSDCSGLVVSMTQTIGPIFGAKVASPSLGFAYAATMGGYLRTGPQKPGERPRTAIAPVIVTKEDSVLLALGAAGGIRIPSAIVQTISRVVDQNKSLKDAINAPRVHPLALIDENNRRIIDLRSFSAEMSSPAWTENDLAYWKLNGFNVTELEKRATFGRVHAISQFNAKLVGVADPDWEGSASTEKNCAK